MRPPLIFGLWGIASAWPPVFAASPLSLNRCGLPAEFLDHFSVERRNVSGLAAGDQAIVGDDFLTFNNRARLVEIAAAARLPAIYLWREYPEAGGLISYGPNLRDLNRRAAAYVDKILKGAKPGDLPIEQPTKFELVINLKTAKALGLTIPQTLLLRADQLIE